MFVPISGAFATLGFLIGFIFTQYADTVALAKSVEADEDARKRIDDIVNDTHDRLLSVTLKLYSDQQEYTKAILAEQNSAREALKSIKNLTVEAEELDKKVSQLESIKDMATITVGITESLKKDKTFQSEISEKLKVQITKLSQQIEELENAPSLSSAEAGVIDLAGKYRLQWGRFTTVKNEGEKQRPIIFPAPFGDNNPIVIASTSHSKSSKYRGRPVNIEELKADSFVPAVAEDKWTTLAVECMYIAIGSIP